jgi:VRR-NUC domain
LLLIRVSRPRECYSPSNKTTGAVDDLAVAVAGDRDSEVGDRGRSRDKVRNGDREGGRDRDRDWGRGREAGRDRGGPPKWLDIADILGYDWDVLIDTGDDSNEGQEGSTKSLDQGKKDQDDREGEVDGSSIAPYRDDSSSVKTKGRYNKWRKRKTQDVDNDDLQSLGRTKRELADADQLSAKASMKLPSVSIFHTLKRSHTESSVVVDISDDADIDADADEILLSELCSVTFQQVNNVTSEEDVWHSHTVGEDENACVDADSDPATEQAVHDRAPSPSLDRFVCTLADLILPLNDVSSPSQHSNLREGSAEDCFQSASEQAVSGQVCSRGSVHEGWKYECMMVEVKGPTDSLADHQLMWLCVLSSSNVATFVAHVKETSLIE